MEALSIGLIVGAVRLSMQVGDLVRVKRRAPALQPDIIGLVTELKSIGGNRGAIVKPSTAYHLRFMFAMLQDVEVISASR